MSYQTVVKNQAQILWHQLLQKFLKRYSEDEGYKYSNSLNNLKGKWDKVK